MCVHKEQQFHYPAIEEQEGKARLTPHINRFEDMLVVSLFKLFSKLYKENNWRRLFGESTDWPVATTVKQTYLEATKF